MWKPGASVGTTKPRTPSSVCAHTIAQLRDRREPDPALRPGEHPVVAVAAREGLHARGVGARGGLGETEAADHLAARHPRQPLLLLLLAAPAVDRAHRERALHRHERADAGVAGLELEGREPVLDGAAAGASVSVEVHTEHAELAEGGRELGREHAPGRTSRRCAGGSARRRSARTRSRTARSSSLSSASMPRTSDAARSASRSSGFLGSMRHSSRSLVRSCRGSRAGVSQLRLTLVPGPPGAPESRGSAQDPAGGRRSHEHGRCPIRAPARGGGSPHGGQCTP